MAKLTPKKKVSVKAKPAARKSSQKAAADINIFPFLGFGVLFGYFLSKARATDYDTIVGMFMFKDFQLWGVIAVAIALIAAGLFLLRVGGRPTQNGKALDWQPLEWNPSRLIGALIFGAGWALAGTCPGTALTQIGEGKVVALFTVAGIFVGVWLYKKYPPMGNPKDDQVC